MIGFGAIIKSILKVADQASSAIELGIRAALNAPRPKPCPIPVTEEPRRRRR